MYGAKEVVFSETAQSKMTSYKKLKLDEQPVCMAKTQLSLSHDSKRKGRPRGFKLPINDLNIANGAGFINVLCGDIKTMPGLPQKPRGEKIEVDKTGRIVNI